jgi:hypothetical protein
MVDSKLHVILSGAAGLLLSFAVACGSSGGGAAPLAPGAPTVTSSSPATDATDVPLDGSISATFSEAMDPATLVEPAP